MMYRREVFEATGGYRSECVYWEDHDLILRMAAISKIMVLPYAVYGVRQSTVSTRLASDRRRVEQAVDLMYRCRQRVEKGQSYDDLLEASPKSAKIDPRVFISIGSVELWGGGRPRLFRRMLHRADLRGDFRSLAALVWAAWAALEPHTLRTFMRLLLIVRNLRTPKVTRTNEPVVWPVGGLTGRS